jgi:ubiquinone/menaquinone biosynthesis C-methylase UbiE
MSYVPSAGPQTNKLMLLPCIVCGSSESTVFITRNKYSIRSCSQCKLRFLWPQPGPLELQAVYEDSYFLSGDSADRGYSDYLAQSTNHRRLFRDRLQRLPRPRAGHRLLDFGAAAGFFVEQASLHGWDAEGIEINERMLRYGRDTLGCRMSSATLEQLRTAEAQFDMITMWEVIEHLPNPGDSLRAMHALLKSGGNLALTTPDAGSLSARATGKRWLGWRKVPEHLYFFDAGNLKRLLGKYGFDIVHEAYVPLFVDAAYAFERLSAILGISAVARMGLAWKHRTLKINPFYDLMLVARRQ